MKKYVLLILATLSLQACGTVGGAISGAGEDLKQAGDYIRTVGK